jgi:hypothetical protein
MHFLFSKKEKMKLLDGHWVKPFGTGISCIDTIDAECPRGISLEECMKQCEESPYCNAGYHVSFDEIPLPSYCVPLNTIFYQNSNFLDNAIAPTNKTRLSADNGIHVHVFYNPDRFPADENLMNTPYLFFSNTVYLVQDRGAQGGKYYLHSDFAFYPIQETAMTVVLGQENTLMTDFDLRLTTSSRLYFIKNDEYSILYYDREAYEFSWRPYSAIAYTYAFRDHPQGFVNEREPFQLFNGNHQQYLTVDHHTNRLVWSKDKSPYPLSFELDPTSPVNQFSRTNWKEVPRTFPQIWDSLNQKRIPQFLCENFNNCTTRTAQPLSPPFWIYLTAMVGTLVILVSIVSLIALRAARKTTKAKTLKNKTR